jgi:hypothetical protein
MYSCLEKKFSAFFSGFDYSDSRKQTPDSKIMKDAQINNKSATSW